MAIKPRTELQGKFITGAKPKQEDFTNLMDSYLHVSDNLPANTVLSAITSASSGDLKTALRDSFHSYSGHEIIVDADFPEATDNRTGISKYDRNRPFKTFAAALAVGVYGDVVRIMPGNYSGNCTLGNQWLTIIMDNCNIGPLDSNLPVFESQGTLTIVGNGNSTITDASGAGTHVIKARGVNLYNVDIDANKGINIPLAGFTSKISNCTITGFFEAISCAATALTIVNSNLRSYSVCIKNTGTSDIKCFNTNMHGVQTCIDNVSCGIALRNCNLYSDNGYGIKGQNTITAVTSVRDCYFNTWNEGIYQGTDGVHGSNIEVLNSVFNVRNAAVARGMYFTGTPTPVTTPLVYGNKCNKQGFDVNTGGSTAPAGDNLFNIPMASVFPFTSQYPF